MPSAACGIVGLKPSHGEVPLDGVVPLSASLDHVGPLALGVQDAAWLHAVMAGETPWMVEPARAGQLRLCRLTGYFDGPLAPDVRESFSRALDALAVAGVHIDTAPIPDADQIAENYLRVVLPEGAYWHAPFLDSRAADYTPSVHSRLLSGRTFTAVEYLAGQAFRDRLRRSVDLAFGDADALVLPTLPIVAPMLGAEMITVEPGTAEVTVRSAMLRHTQPFNLTGHPAITLPIAAPGLPVGLQLVGRRNGTRRLLDVAATVERLLSS
jgi:aspartyl-tRNA(Asn)/glutamyl-tRNA(Gln) amidotransferase subunit A